MVFFCDANPEAILMFERYTEKARRVVFFARFEASQYGSPYIETEHLLLGLLREDRALAMWFIGQVNADEIREEVEKHITARERISTSVEVPLTSESKKVLTFAAEEADRLGHRHVGTEHILLGLLRVEDSLAGAILQAKGVKVASLRERMAKAIRTESIKEPPTAGKRALDTLDSFLAGLKWSKAEELLKFFAENAQFVDVHGKRWTCEQLHKEFDTLFAPYAKKNATYIIEEKLSETVDLLVVIVRWKNAILASLERVWTHRMSFVLVPHGDNWTILLVQVTLVHPT